MDDPLDFELDDPLLRRPYSLASRRSHVEVARPEEAVVDEGETKKIRKKKKRYGVEAEEEAALKELAAFREIESARIRSIPLVDTIGRRKVIDLDDLLNDHYNEVSKSVKEHVEDSKKNNHVSDDDEDIPQHHKERELSKFVEICQKQVHEMETGEDVPMWGLQVFGRQKPPPNINLSDLQSCKLLQSPDMTILNGVLDVEGENFLEGLLKNGWLLMLVCVSGYVEDSIASWTFYKMMYSSNEELHSSACGFWCGILSKQISLPARCFSLMEMKYALETYGYLFGPFCISLMSVPVETDHKGHAPPSNIRSWLKFVSAICKSRGSFNLLSSTEVEELAIINLCLFLERMLQGLTFLLDECLSSILSCFSDEEWCTSCEKIAVAVAGRIQRDLNCLHAIESISLADLRGKNLRSRLAYQFLMHFFKQAVIDAEGITKFLLSIDLKEKNCDFFKVYIYLFLVQNWLFSEPQIEMKESIIGMWLKFLRNCSTQITCTDWRSYASKVRNRASYLIQLQTR